MESQNRDDSPPEIDGSWIKGFKPVMEGFNARGFCESNSAIYTHYVPQDMGGLIELFGGNQKYNQFLNKQKENIPIQFISILGSQYSRSRIYHKDN